MNDAYVAFPMMILVLIIWLIDRLKGDAKDE